MSCCGDPVHKDNQYTNRQPPLNTGIVQQQPPPHAPAHIYEKPALLASPASPLRPSPPPQSFQSHRPPSQWGAGSPSPPPPSIHQSMNFGVPGAQPGISPLYQPSPVHALHRNGSTSPSLSLSVTQSAIGSAYGSTAPTSTSDEGRMSISIDFGAFFPLMARGALSDRAYRTRNYVFGRGACSFFFFFCGLVHPFEQRH